MSVLQGRYGWSDEKQTCAHEYLLPAVLEEVRRISGGRGLRVLDLGCGNGAVAGYLAKHGHLVTGVDVSADGISIARSAFPECRFEVCSLYDERLTSLVGVDFDCVISLEVLEHLFYPRQLFRRGYQALRPGGHLVISTPYHGYLKNLALSLVGGWDRHFNVGQDGGHIKFFSKRTLWQMALEAGFRVQRIRGVGRAPWLWKSMIMVAVR